MYHLFHLERYPLRTRLTAWYSLLLGFILLLFSGFLYLQLKLNLLSQLDSTLKLTASYAYNHLNFQYKPPVFLPEESKNLSRYLKQGDFAIRLMTPKGQVWHGLGNYQSIPLWIPQNPGSKNISGPTSDWRIYSQSLHDTRQQSIGWLQVIHSLDSIHAAEAQFIQQVLLSLPLVLLIAGWGGWFLINQALRPIDRVTRTAQELEANDLTKRINYHGPRDEVGRLAMTFDQMLDRIQTAFNRERQFTADVSHELRTPLTTIKGQLAVTLSRNRNLADYQKTLTGIEYEVNRLVRLVNDLLFLARADLKQEQWAMECLDLSYLLDAIIDQATILGADKNIKVYGKVSPGLSVQGNPDQLIRVFLNLVDNAIKYTPSYGEVGIAAYDTKGEPTVEIKDSGMGISAEHIPHLFQRFYRVEKSRDRQSGGTGLGLAIAAEIMQIHGGELLVISVVGQGTNIIAKFPKRSA